MSDEDGSVQDLVRGYSKSMREQTESWLHSLGIHTEADARLVGRDWMIEDGPIETSDDGDNRVRTTQTMRLVRRPKEGQGHEGKVKSDD